MAETWWKYVQRISGETQQKAIAAAVKAASQGSMDVSTVNRWAKGGRPSADNATTFARAYGDSPQAALLIAGYLQEEDIDTGKLIRIDRSLAERHADELIEEIRRRIPSAAMPGNGYDFRELGTLSDSVDNRFQKKRKST